MKAGLSLLLIGTLAACSPPLREDVIGPLYRANKSMMSALGVGLNYAAFGEEVRQYATELTIAQTTAKTDVERKIVTESESALGYLTDSLAVWGTKIQQSEWLHEKTTPEVAGWIAKYHVVTNQFGAARADDIIHNAWSRALVHTRAAALAYEDATK